eukprot:SAG22_NODE_3413_length_1728_cov_1.082873_2_plen_52_part_01
MFPQLVEEPCRLPIETTRAMRITPPRPERRRAASADALTTAAGSMEDLEAVS